MNVEKGREILKKDESQEDKFNISSALGISFQSPSFLPKYMGGLLMIMIFSFRFSDEFGLLNLTKTSENNSEGENPSFNLQSLINLIHYIPNVTIPIFAGYLIDYLGVMDMLNYSHFTMIIGSIICYLWARGKASNGYPSEVAGQSYMQIEYFMSGRIIFGLGCESLWVCSIVLLCYWFRKRNFGVSMNIVFIAYYLEGIALDAVYLIFRYFGYFHYKSDMDRSLQYNLGVSLLFAVVSSISGCFISNFERKRQLEAQNLAKDRYNPLNQKSFWQSFKKILLFRPIFIIIGGALIMSTIRVSLTYLDSYTIASFEDFKRSRRNIARGMSILFNLVAIGTSFLVGRLIDFKGHRAFLLIIGAFHVTMGFIMKYIIIHNDEANQNLKVGLFFFSMIIMGFGASFIYGNIYSCAAVLVKERYYGIFYGFLTALKNILNFILTASFESKPNYNVAKSEHQKMYQDMVVVGISINVTVVLMFLVVQIYDKNHKHQVLSKLPRSQQIK